MDKLRYFIYEKCELNVLDYERAFLMTGIAGLPIWSIGGLSVGMMFNSMLAIVPSMVLSFGLVYGIVLLIEYMVYKYDNMKYNTD